jgi:gamma-glutamyltranspeptidase/glutathione hydrolase
MRDFHLPGRSPLHVSNAIAATSHPLAAKAAIDMLEAGGNAVDAAIAGAVVLGLGEPAMTGIGGDMFALVGREGESGVTGLNASGRAPAALDPAGLRARGWSAMEPDDANAVVVPGAIAGFDRLAADHGRLGLDRVLAPAIRLADEGVRVVPRAAFDWARAEPRMRGAMRRHYLVDGRVPAPGDLFRAPGQAEVLRRIARDGARAFYEGEVAEDMVESLRALGGTHTLEDFSACGADYVIPVSGHYRGHELVELPPNGQGATAILMAQMLERFDIAGLDPMGAERAHLELEIQKIAYAARDEAIADPAHMTVPVERFTDPETAAALAARIDPARAATPPLRPLANEHKETILITVVDRDRMAVSLIYSVFNDFGGCLASEKFGINFNNRAAGFSLAEGHPNEAGGGKRPMHTIIPALLRKDGETVMAFGVMGGGYQPQGHVRVMSNMLDYGMDVQAAIDAARLSWRAGEVAVERGYAPEVTRALEAMEHVTVCPEVPLGGAQAVWIDRARGLLSGGSDPRKDGLALGY